jgi:hypothetical protein
LPTLIPTSPISTPAISTPNDSADLEATDLELADGIANRQRQKQRKLGMMPQRVGDPLHE